MALALGSICGLAIVIVMNRAGMLAERSGLAVLLAAIAAFWPVFAIADGHDAILHLAGFAGFLALALAGFVRGALWLVAGLALHGLWDAGLALGRPPGPAFWPAFCAALDLAAAAALALLWQKGRLA